MSSKTKTSKTSATKRKDPDALLGSDEDDEPAVTQVSKNDKNDPRASAKRAFLAQYKNPVPTTRTIRTGGQSLPTVSVEGVVTRMTTRTYPGRSGQSVPKLEVSVDVHRVRANGAPDVIVSGVPGFEYLLPTHRPKMSQDAADDSPEGGSKGKDAKNSAPPRALVLHPNHKTICLGTLARASFYLTAAGKGADGKVEAKKGMDLIQPGMPVEVTGCVAALSDDGTTLWLNTQTISPRLDGLPSGKGPETMFNYLSAPVAMETSAIRLSQTMRGFHGESQPTPVLELQAASAGWVAGSAAAGASAAVRPRGVPLGHGVTQLPKSEAAKGRGVRPLFSRCLHPRVVSRHKGTIFLSFRGGVGGGAGDAKARGRLSPEAEARAPRRRGQVVIGSRGRTLIGARARAELRNGDLN